jgi:hypothetical protein
MKKMIHPLTLIPSPVVFLRNTFFGALLLLLVLALHAPTACAQSSGAKPCIVFIDDVSKPDELKRNGIEPFDPNGLAHAFDEIAAKNVPCTILYVAVRSEAARSIPVITEIPENQELPPSPPESGLKLPDLQNAWLAYRKAKTAYDEHRQAYESRLEEARQQFIIKNLDALAGAETELTNLRRGWTSRHASDVEGTILGAVSTAKTLRASSVLLVLNTDLRDDPGYRHARATAFTDSELPPDLVRGLVIVNTSFRPDSSPLIAETSIAKHHALSLKAAVDLVANLLPSIK